VTLQLGFRNPSLDQLVKGSEVRRSNDFCRWLVVLEHSDLSLELIVELSQCLLLMDDILAVESRLLPIMIRLGLLFFYLLFYIGEHLNELVFVLLWWLDTSTWLLRRGAVDVLSGMRLIDGWWKDCAPSGADGLAFGYCVVEVDSLLSWSHRHGGRGFLRKVFSFWEEDLECRDLALNEITSL